jgi:hypothetical protein
MMSPTARKLAVTEEHARALEHAERGARVLHQVMLK